MAQQVNRERPIKLNFFVSESELEFIKKKMMLAGSKNMSAYFRKMVIDGFILNVGFKEFKEVSANMGKIGGSINQIIRRINSTNNVYAEDVSEIKTKQEELWQLLNSLLSEIRSVEKLAKVE